MAQKILEKFPELTPDDVRSTSSGSGGRDVLLSQAAKRLVPFAIECKSRKSFAVYEHFQQAKSHIEGDEFPMLVIKQDRSEPLVLLQLKDFMEIYGDKKSNKNS